MTMVLDGLEQWGGVPVGSQAAYPTPLFGTHWFVNGATGKGSDDNPGTSKLEPMATIQAAVTAQIAYPSGIGDVIWVTPGTYVESIVGDLVNASIIGTGVSPGAVQITPESSYAYNGKMTNAALRNMQFVSPSSSSKELAAVFIDCDMEYSVIDNCHIFGAHADCVVGLQIGEPDTADTWEAMLSVQITNNLIGGGGTKGFDEAINLFASDSTSNDAKKWTGRCLISGNRLYAHQYGIRINTHTTNNRNTVFSYNTIGNDANWTGPIYGIRMTGGTDISGAVASYNSIGAVTTGIAGFQTATVIGNIIATNGANPTGTKGYGA